MRTRSWRTRIAALARDRNGAAALEFAVVFPFLALLWLGMTEVSVAVAANKKMTAMGSMMADLIAQETTMSVKVLDEILSISRAGLYPYLNDSLRVSVFCIENGAPGGARVVWRGSMGGAVAGAPPPMMVDVGAIGSGSFIVVQSSMDVAPVSGVIDASYRMTGLAVSKVRSADGLACDDCSR